MAHYPITNTGTLGTLDGTIGNSSAISDVLVYNDSEAAIVVSVQITGVTAVSGTINKKSTFIFENYGAGITAGPTTLIGGTTHGTSAHTGARVHAYLVNEGADTPTVPTDNVDDA